MIDSKAIKAAALAANRGDSTIGDIELHWRLSNPAAALEMCSEIERLTTEVNEQARLLGISAERELRMRSVMQQALHALDYARVEYDNHGMPMDECDRNVELAAVALMEALNHDSDGLSNHA